MQREVSRGWSSHFRWMKRSGNVGMKCCGKDGMWDCYRFDGPVGIKIRDTTYVSMKHLKDKYGLERRRITSFTGNSPGTYLL
jgi:hypothetical protein